MGSIQIHIAGSFLTPEAGLLQERKTISAMDHGHAQAVAEAITFLSEEVLPRAIALDHMLHENGEKPRGGFDRRP